MYDVLFTTGDLSEHRALSSGLRAQGKEYKAESKLYVSLQITDQIPHSTCPMPQAPNPELKI